MLSGVFMPIFAYFAVVAPALLGLLFLAEAHWGPGTPPRVEAPLTQKILVTRDTSEQQRYPNEPYVAQAPAVPALEVTSSNRTAEAAPPANAEASAAQASAAKPVAKQKRSKHKVARHRAQPGHQDQAGYRQPAYGRQPGYGRYGPQPRYARQGGFPFFNGF
jgi:hypothetical protein